MLAARLMLVALLAAAVLGLGSIAPRGTERQHHHSSPIRVVSGTSSGAAPPPPKPPADEYENQVYYENVAPHPFNVTDLVRADRIGNPVVSPNGQFAVYTRRVWSVSLNQSSTTLWVSYISSGAMAPLTPFGYGVSESDPCWLPDSNTVLFLSNRQLGTTQIWQVQVPATPSQMAASPVRISSFPVDLLALKVSPSGTQLAFAAAVYPGLSMQQTAERDAANAANPTRAFTYTKLFVRHWDTFFDGHRNHPFLAPLTKGSNGSYIVGNPHDVLFNVDADAPTKPYGGSEEWSFSTAGDEFSFTRRYDETTRVAWTTNLDLHYVSIAGGYYSSPVCYSCGNTATDTQPRYQPNGLLIAYVATEVPGYEADRYRIKIYNRSLNSTIVLTESWDRSVSAVSWSPDGTYLIAEVLDIARNRLYKVSLSGEITLLVSEHSSQGATVLPDSSLVFARQSMTSPVNIFQWFPATNSTRQLTNFNAELLKKCWMSTPQEFWFKGANGDPVHGWYLEPVAGTVPNGAKVPLAYLIHGGPQGSWSDDWSYRWNPQIYAAHGYAVGMIDFHGSEGYGQPFTDSIQNDYGGKPFTDILNSLDFLIDNHPNINPSRLLGLGASYGGWMVNWINGHTNRFRALVCHDGIFDQRMLYFETEELWFPEHDMEGNPMNATADANYEKWNPSAFANQWQTPQLTIHGGKDYRIVDSQGMGAFTALQRRGIPSKFVYLPTENHWVLNPCNLIYWFNAILEWCDEWAA